MKLLDLAAIRARCDAATPGPWTYDEEAGYVDIGLPRYRSIAIGIEMDATTKSDGDFIARARADVPALLAYVHDLEQELAENDRLRIANAEERALTAEERLEQMTRERDEARDEARAEVKRLRGVLNVMLLDEYESTTSASDKVHDHARRAREALARTTASDGPSDKAHIATLENLFLKACIRADKHKQELAENDRLRDALAERALTAEERLEQMTRERDEARAQLAAIGAGSPCDGHRHCCADRRKLAEELLRVRAERDEARLKAQHLERHLEIWETPYCACGRRLTDCDGSRARCLGSQSGSLGINEDAKRR